MNKYSCGNDPQPGDVVEVVTMEDLPEESWWNQAITEKLQKEKHYSVFAVAFGDWICLFNKPEIIWHHPSRFRLIHRAGEQPQPDMAKLLEEKEREIERLKEQVNDLKMDAAAHEYNEAERIKFQPEYEREICVRFAEYIGGLEMKMYKDGWCEPGGSNGFYYSTNDLYTKFLGEHTANH